MDCSQNYCCKQGNEILENCYIASRNSGCPAGKVAVQGEIIGECEKGKLCVKVRDLDWRKAIADHCGPAPRLLAKLHPVETKSIARPPPPVVLRKFRTRIENPKKTVKKKTIAAFIPDQKKAKKENKADTEELGQDNQQQNSIITIKPTIEDIETCDSEGKPMKQNCFVFDVCVRAKRVPGTKTKPKEKECDCKSICRSSSSSSMTNVTVETSFLTRHEFPETNVLFYKK